MSRIPREDAEIILRRAIEFDTDEKNTLSVEELHAIARELNISSRALDLALHSNVDPVPIAQQRQHPMVYPASIVIPAHMAIAGAALMTVTQIVSAGRADALVMAYIAAALFGLAQRDPTTRVTRIIKGSAAFWLSAMLTYGIFDRVRVDDIGKAFTFFALSCAVGIAAGGLRYLSEERTSTADAADTGTPPSQGGGSSWRVRVLKKIAKWLPGDPMNSTIVERVHAMFRAA